MEKAKKTYEGPVMTKVNFKDKELVAFAICKKQGSLQGDGGCCALAPFGTPNRDQFDPS